MNKPNYPERRQRVRATLDFLLHRWLKVETLCERLRFADHNAETFGAVFDSQKNA